MFETAEIGRKLSKEDYEEIAPALRIELLELQQELRKTDLPVLVVFAGVDGAGKGETVQLLNEWMDPRWMVTHAYSKPSEEEAERPPFWRYWRDMPPKGRFGLYLSSWYSAPVLDRAYGRISKAELDQRLLRVREFEKALTDDGALILKFWMHLDRKGQRKRLESLQKDPLKAWRVTDTDWKHNEMYDDFVASAERTIRRTSHGDAPWFIVEGADERYRSITVCAHIRDQVRRHIDSWTARRLAAKAKVTASEDNDAPARVEIGRGSILGTLDMTLTLDHKLYKRRLKEQQARLNELHRKARERGVSTVLVFEGADAAGKGGSIRRVTRAIDARDYRVIPIAAPTDEERAQHYLWRFWRHLGRAGKFTIFDRSWYGRVLVERVEGFATQEEWMRAYAEINHFEERLAEHGVVLVKYWLHITPEEQLARFEARAQIPYKQWKLTEEDWRNRDRWGDYLLAVDEMVERTSTSVAPWTLVEGCDKPYARVKVITTACDALEKALK